MWTPTDTLLDSALKLLNDDTVPSNTLLAGSFLAFLKAPHDFSFSSVYGDVSAKLATSLGYPPLALTFTGPFTGQGGKDLLSGGGHVITMGGSDTGATIYGHVILGDDSVTLLAGEIFDTPVALGTIGDGFVDNPLFGIAPNAAGFGNSVVSS